MLLTLKNTIITSLLDTSGHQVSGSPDSYQMTDIALSQRSSSILKHGFLPTHVEPATHANTRNSRKLKTHFWQFDNMRCEHLQRNMVQVAQVTVDVHVFRTTIKCDKHTSAFVTEVGYSSAMLENKVKLIFLFILP